MKIKKFEFGLLSINVFIMQLRKRLHLNIKKIIFFYGGVRGGGGGKPSIFQTSKKTSMLILRVNSILRKNIFQKKLSKLQVGFEKVPLESSVSCRVN